MFPMQSPSRSHLASNQGVTQLGEINTARADTDEALSAVIQSNDIEKFKSYVDEHSLDIRTYRSKEDLRNVLHLAIESGSGSIAMFLLGLGGEANGLTLKDVQRLVNARDYRADTPLMRSIDRHPDKPSWVEALIQAGAIDDDGSGLFWAAKYGHASIVNALIHSHLETVRDRGLADIARDVREYASPFDYREAVSHALVYAAAQGHMEIFRKLIEVDTLGQFGTALQGAALNGHLPIIDILLQKTSYDRQTLSVALMYAAANNHVDLAKRLSDAGADASQALARALQLPPSLTGFRNRAMGQVHIAQYLRAANPMYLDGSGTTVGPMGELSWQKQAAAIQCLRALGADAQAALRFAAGTQKPISAPVLHLLGADGAEWVPFVALAKDKTALNWLLDSDASFNSAFRRLARSDNATAVDFVMDHCHTRKGYREDGLSGLTRQAFRTADFVSCRALERMRYGQYKEEWIWLAVDGHQQALRLLKDANLLNPKPLKTLVRQHHLSAIKTAVQAGIPTDGLLLDLYEEHMLTLVMNDEREIPQEQRTEDKRGSAIALLILAGADVWWMGQQPCLQQINQAIIERQQLFASLSPAQRDERLFDALTRADVTDIALLLEHNANPIVTLAIEDRQIRRTGLANMIKAGLDASEILIDWVTAGRMELAEDLVEASKLASLCNEQWTEPGAVVTRALKRLIARNDMPAAARLIPVFTDGAEALIHFAQESDESAVKLLMQLGAADSAALLGLLEHNDYGASGRLIECGADIHTTLMLTFSERQPVTQAAVSRRKIRRELQIIGAEVTIALQRAAERNDMSAARGLIEYDPASAKKTIDRLVEENAISDAVKTEMLQCLGNVEATTVFA
ncbi:ankyrin repeat domain-containing protein [Bordetella sp. 02P26C-1]|uniref:ankyrin repeat domain-containing protein n=1 Tax=Bordetella sp. 02P26C-1 TaxID=2683195 RepID=UPI0013545DA9|nr:ankyrin repeat domain-containing protein [Bordetella sp. 02P26C-1]MVW77552.1 hypothetical protein [Bordetella sp. 02P26C-1]